MKFLLKILFLLLIPFLAGAQPPDPFEWDFDARVKTIRPGGNLPLEVTFMIPPKHFLYKDKITLSLLEGEGFEVGSPEFTPPMRKRDPFSGKELDVFEGGAVLRTSLRARNALGEGPRQVKFLLTYQGCSNTLCYRLMKREIDLSVTVVSQEVVAPGSLWDHPSNPFRKRGFLVLLLLTFLGGIVSDFTPCVLPIIPITLAFIGLRKDEARVGRNFFLSLSLVLSMSVTYALLGLLAAILGRGLGFLFQNFYFLLFAALLYLTFALSLLGLFQIQLPLRLRNPLAKIGGSGVLGSILSGATVGFLAAPCVGPVIASLLLYVAQDRDIPKGLLLLFSYGIGMGSLFLLIGSFYHRLASRLRAGTYAVWVKRLFAVILLVPAFYYGAVAYGHLRRAPESHETSFWIHDPREGFQLAALDSKPIFIDFYASWCLPCVEMENRAFRNEELKKILSDKFVPIKVDCSQETPICQEMVEKYSVVGWPTFLILNPKGEVLESIVGKSLSARELQDLLMASSPPWGED